MEEQEARARIVLLGALGCQTHLSTCRAAGYLDANAAASSGGGTVLKHCSLAVGSVLCEQSSSAPITLRRRLQR